MTGLLFKMRPIPPPVVSDLIIMNRLSVNSVGQSKGFVSLW